MKRYIAILNSNGQTMTVTVLENSLGNIDWNGGVGTLQGAFPADKTVAFISGGAGGEKATLTTVELPANSEDFISVKAYDFTAEGDIVQSLGLLVRTSLEIRVYE